MTLSHADYTLLKNHTRHAYRMKLALFPGIDLGSDISFSAGGSLAAALRPLALVSPPYAVVAPGEALTLYGGDSFERGGAAATGHTWTLQSGSASLSAAGAECEVIPTGGENSYVVVRLTVSDSSANTAYRDAHIFASTKGWNPGAVTNVEFGGAFDSYGWSGNMRIAGHESDFGDLAAGKLLLIHLDTYWNGSDTPYNIGGYKRPQNLCLLEVKDFRYNKGAQEVNIELISPSAALERLKSAMAYSVEDGELGALQYVLAGAPLDDHWYMADLRFSDALHHLASSSESFLSRDFNFTIAHDQYEFSSFNVNIGTAGQQLKDIAKSAFYLAFCNFTGSMQLTQHRIVRGDEYWGTPDGIWSATVGDGPLTKAFVFDDKLGWEVDYRDTNGYRQAKVVGQRFVSGMPHEEAVFSTETNTSGRNDFYEQQGIYIPTLDAAADWADDLLAQANRTWDLTVTMVGSNVLNVGDTLDVSLVPSPTGLAEVVDTGWVKAVKHRIDHTRGVWLTTSFIEQVTAG